MLLITDIKGRTAGLDKPLASKQCLSRYVDHPSRESNWLSGALFLRCTRGVPQHGFDIALVRLLHLERVG